MAAGLLGSNWLFHLEMANKKVLQASATVIPAAATLYCMGIEARTGLIAGFDLSSFNKYRSATALICNARAPLKCRCASSSALMNGAYQGCMWLVHSVTGVVAARIAAIAPIRPVGRATKGGLACHCCAVLRAAGAVKVG